MQADPTRSEEALVERLFEAADPCQRRAARPNRSGALSARRRQSSSASAKPTCSSSAADESASVTLPWSRARRKRAKGEPCAVTNRCSQSAEG